MFHWDGWALGLLGPTGGWVVVWWTPGVWALPADHPSPAGETASRGSEERPAPAHCSVLAWLPPDSPGLVQMAQPLPCRAQEASTHQKQTWLQALVGCGAGICGRGTAQPGLVCLLNTSRTSCCAWLRNRGSSEARKTGVRPGCPKLARLSWRASPDLNASSEPWGQLSLRMRGEGESYTQ